jgi:hypothetical protein
MAGYLVVPISIVLFLWACLPLPLLRLKVVMLGVLLLVIGGICVYAIRESGPAAIVPLLITVGLTAIIAFLRLASAIYNEVSRHLGRRA